MMSAGMTNDGLETNPWAAARGRWCDVSRKPFLLWVPQVLSPCARHLPVAPARQRTKVASAPHLLKTFWQAIATIEALSIVCISESEVT
jgi:hypothetical protein